MEKIDLIENTINKIDNLIKEQLPESKYQFELFDLTTNTKHFRGLDEPFHWGSVYKLFVVAEIIKMSEEGLLSLENELILHKERYQKGSGPIKFFTHLDRLTYIDACKMVMAISDNLCADELLNDVGLLRMEKLLKKSGCKSSALKLNLNSLVEELFSESNGVNSASYFHSEKFNIDFKNKLDRIITKNYTTVSDTNKCFHFTFSEYLNEHSLKRFKECVIIPNVHTRLAYYTFFGNYKLRGKSGMLGLGLVNNETVAIFNQSNDKIVGYFSINTKDNSKRYFQANDTFGLIGLEIAKLYEGLEEMK